MSDFGGFYRAFEDRERGSRELILGRLDQYRPLLQYVAGQCAPARALDVGCGRGEWLQVVCSEGIDGYGVDLDAGMLEACREQGLAVEQGDALAWLAAQPDASLALITAFHVVEHLPFDSVQQLVDEAHRVLQPGGLLIMETPNPENLSVGAHTFYLDPTHERPLPPALLRFVPEFVGFARTWVWRLQEHEHLRGGADPVLANVLLAVSPDYAVIARKATDADVSAFDQLVDEPRGLELRTACERYDAVQAAPVQALARSAEQMQLAFEQQIAELRDQLSDVQDRMTGAEQKAANLEWLTYCQQQELDRIANSFSWQLVYPVRWVGLQWRLLRQQGARERGKAALRKVAAPSIRFIDRSTRNSLRLRHALLSLARKLGVHHRVMRFYQHTRMQQAASAHDDRVFELSESQKRAQSAWLPVARKLEVDELLSRIRSELQAPGSAEKRLEP